MEYTFWSALVQLTQLQQLYAGMMLEKALPPGIERTEIRRRIREAQQQCAVVRALIEETHVLESDT